MLLTFKSKAASDVLMYRDHARRILDLWSKDLERGVITAAEAAGAISALQAEIEESKTHPASEEVLRDVQAHHRSDGDDSEHESAELVSFATRSYPLLEMLRAAQRNGCDIVWERE